MTTIQPDARLDGRHSTRRAWWSLLGFAPSFVLAFVVGEGLISALGYPTGDAVTPPLWAILVAGVPALVVFALPAVLGVHFGRRALAQGDRSARVPMTVGVVVAAGFVLLNLVSGIAVWLGS